MPRTKGAKGKKTLAKELNMTLEQYEEFIKNGNKINSSSNLNPPSPPTSITPSPTELNLEPDFNITKEEPEIKLNLKEEINDKFKINLKEPIPPVSDIILNVSDTSLEPPETKAKTTTSKTSKLPLCERCHTPITSTPPLKINLTYLTTFPSYRREICSDRPLLCYDCIYKLNKLIDKWLWNNGEGINLKFGASEYPSEYPEDKDEIKTEIESKDEIKTKTELNLNPTSDTSNDMDEDFEF